MDSFLSTVTRSVPLQERSSRRIAQFLEIAGDVIAEVGYDAMTMTEVAERADCSIGALYRWFPDKAALAQALRSQYATEFRGCWGPLMEAKDSTVPEFAEMLVDRMAEFCRKRPAYLPLLAAHVKFTKDPVARKLLREQFTELLHAYDPEITDSRALLVANVSIQIIKGLISLYAETAEEERDDLTQEMKTVLSLYLSKALSADPS